MPISATVDAAPSLRPRETRPGTRSGAIVEAP
jgi:hypothetical protein